MTSRDLTQHHPKVRISPCNPAHPEAAFVAAEAAAVLGPELARLGISGGAVYDALVGAAARQHGLSLVSGDARARPAYEALGVRVRLIG
jgi:predicted nucleic acid-binding protein